MPDGSGHASVERDLPGLPSTNAEPKRRREPRKSWFPGSLLIGLVGLLAALAVPFAPVVANDVTVSWPKAGSPPKSTMAFFVPYEPESVHLDVPCPVVRAGQRDTPTTLLSSHLPGQPTKGFAVTTDANHALVLVGGAEVLRSPIAGPGADCSVSIEGTPQGSTVSIGDQTRTTKHSVEEINTFATDLTPQQANGMRATAQTANWFESYPSAGKQALIMIQLIACALALVLLARMDRTRAVPKIRTSSPGRLLRGLVDLGVCSALGGWLVLGPNTPDDSFASMTVRNALNIGDVGNYYRWENSSEAPFTLVQRMLEYVAALGPDPVLMRIPSVVAGVLTWFVLSRGILNITLPGHGRRLPVRGFAALAFLAWWLPFGLGVRPEAFAALGLTAVLACVLIGVMRGRLIWVGLGALIAGLSVAVNAMGIAILAPLIVLGPRIWRIVRGYGLVARITLLGCLGSFGVVIMFADQSLFGARQATRLHSYYGPNVPWFQEIQRYEHLLGFNLEGDIARRTPLLLTGVVLFCCALLLGRGARRLPGMNLAHVAPACLAISMVLLWLTPSKWTHYFGALAGFGGATLTTGVVLILTAARHWAGYRIVVLLSSMCTAISVIAAALAFSGKNTWFFYSNFGVPWEDGPLRPLNSPLTWVLVSAVLLLATEGPRIARYGERQAWQRGLIRMPALISVVAVGVTVMVVLASFVIAPIRMSDSYTPGGQNLATLGGDSCGIADHLVVTPNVPGGELSPIGGGSELTGFAPDAVPSPAPGGERAWGSLRGGPIATGTMTSTWFTLPDIPRDRELVLSAAGRTGDGNRLALEFGRSDGSATRPLGEYSLDDTDTDPDERPAYPADHVIEDEPQNRPGWRPLHAPRDRIPDGADRVRVRAVDRTTDAGGWLAMTSPRLREVIPMTEYLRDRESVLVDWSMNWAFPCVRDFPQVGGGLVEAPTTLITPPGEFGFGGQAAYTRSIGGTFAGAQETGTATQIPTRLLGTEDKPEYQEWGHLTVMNYPFPGNRYDVRSVPETRWGWRGD